MDSDRVEGNLKEAEGKLTGDTTREQEGKAQNEVGKAKDTAGDAKDAAGDAWDKTKETAGKVSDKVEEIIPGDSDKDGR